jgi:hypothetical protein
VSARQKGDEGVDRKAARRVGEMWEVRVGGARGDGSPGILKIRIERCWSDDRWIRLLLQQTMTSCTCNCGRHVSVVRGRRGPHVGVEELNVFDEESRKRGGITARMKMVDSTKYTAVVDNTIL